MTIPIINTSATNLELTNQVKSLITQKLAPLGRLLVHEREVKVDVTIRRIESAVGVDSYYVSTKLTTDRGSYMAAATGLYLTKALVLARESLRRSISKGASVETYNFMPVKPVYKDEFTLTL